jgi:hypothetical protein
MKAQCPLCNDALYLNSSCTLCEGTRVVDRDLYDRFYALAQKLRNETQIPHQYFEIDSLVLYNVSLSGDPDRFQEYAVYKRREDGNITKVESITVNAPSTRVSTLAGLLMSINKQPLSDFTDQIRAYRDQLTAEEFEAFKKRFAFFAAAY